MFFIILILILLSLFILILSLTFLIESIAACKSFDNQFCHLRNWEKSKVAVIIPAYNEELVIKKTIKSIIPQLKTNDQLIVIADNCTDNTAAISKEMGVIVKERYDKDKRGKGYVLDYGLKLLKNNPPDIVIFIDADSIVEANSIAILTEQAISIGKPVQGLYLMEKPLQATSKDQISAFAFKVKNLVRPLGLSNLKQSCLLTGTGMAFPWDVIIKPDIDIANGNIVEDMTLGLKLTIAGYPPQFCPQAQIQGQLPSKLNASKTQRTRWEHGHLQTLFSHVPELLTESIKQKKVNLLITAIDLAIPPLSLFVLLWLIIFIISLFMLKYTAIFAPLLISLVSGLMIITSILIAWIKFARAELSLKTLIKIPSYFLWKIPIYLQFIFKRQNQWIRTERDGCDPVKDSMQEKL